MRGLGSVRIHRICESRICENSLNIVIWQGEFNEITQRHKLNTYFLALSLSLQIQIYKPYTVLIIKSTSTIKWHSNQARKA